jgi:hypothetical protein
LSAGRSSSRELPSAPTSEPLWSTRRGRHRGRSTVTLRQPERRPAPHRDPRVRVPADSVRARN